MLWANSSTAKGLLSGSTKTVFVRVFPLQRYDNDENNYKAFAKIGFTSRESFLSFAQVTVNFWMSNVLQTAFKYIDVGYPFKGMIPALSR